MTVAAAEADTKPKPSTLAAKIGGNYTALDNGDGTFTLLDIPIFGEVPAGAKRNKNRIDKEWMEAALARNRARAAEGYLPPTHIHHSDEISVKPSYAGKLSLKRVGSILYEGQTLPAIFADILDIPGEVFSVIRKGFMPYRSVEVHDWETPEIDSLALMPTDVPFFRLPLLTVGDIVKRAPAEMFRVEERPGPAQYIRSKDKAMAILFRFEEKSMPDEKKDEKDKDKMAADEDKSKEEMAKLMGGNDAMMTVLTKILALVESLAGGGKAAPVAPEPTPGDENNLAPVAGMKDDKAKGAKMDEQKVAELVAKAAETAALKAITPYAAEVEKLSKKNADAEKERVVRSRIEKAQGELKGIALSDRAWSHLRSMASKLDEKEFDEQVAIFKREMPAEPTEEGEHAAGAKLSEATAGEAEQAIAKFTAKNSGAKASEWAKKQLFMFREAKQLGSFPGSAEEWLDVNWRLEGRSILRA